MVEDETIPGTVKAEFVDRGFHLRRKREICSSALIFGDDYAKFVHDFGFTNGLEQWTDKPVCQHLGVIRRQELCDSGHAVANDVVQQLSGSRRTQ